MSLANKTIDADVDVDVDETIYSCLNLDTPKSFFLFAGAGSGKTRSLVHILQRFKAENADTFRLQGKKVAIITYTNAACDEIKRRLEFDTTFLVATIHSFSWELIKSYQSDIRGWVEDNLKKEILELEGKQSKGRANSQAAAEREEQIESKKRRMAHIGKVRKFVYDPNGTNSSRDSLNHAEVINICAFFLKNKSLLQTILVEKHPIILIDESQDTKKELIEAFFVVQEKKNNTFSLGLFGDTMQRIYADGKADLGINLPEGWLRPAKLRNYRCPTRIVTLINKIRSAVDNHVQIPAEGKPEGIVRLFIVDTNKSINKTQIEANIMQRMSEFTADGDWHDSPDKVKILILEHHMAAKRGGFQKFFENLSQVDRFRTGLLDGTLPGISFFLQQVIPIVEARKQNNKFAVAQIVRKFSPILNSANLKQKKDQLGEIRIAQDGIEALSKLFNNDKKPSLLEIIQSISLSNLLSLPEVLQTKVQVRRGLKQEPEVDQDDASVAWDNALECSYDEIVAYGDYISDKTRFGTHQGVKGLEFPRVMAIMDDEEARGFMFSYDKLFDAKPLSDTDKKNISEKKETAIDRTRRLFYVTCSRAEKSLAIVAYTTSPNNVRNHVLTQGWFSESEINLL